MTHVTPAARTDGRAWHDGVVTAPTPSTPDPQRPRGAHRYDGRGRPDSAREPDPYRGSDPASEGSGTPEGGWTTHPVAYPAQDVYVSGPGVRSEVRSGALCALVLTVLGVGLGLMWLWLSPRVPLVTVDGSVFLKDPEGEEAVGADGTFVLLALGFGVVTGVLAFLRSRTGGIGLVFGLAVGALLGSVVAWRLGVWLGPESDLVAAAKAAGSGKTFDGPLKLQAKSALLVWPLMALIFHLLLTGLLGRDEDVGEPWYPPREEPEGPEGQADRPGPAAGPTGPGDAQAPKGW